MDRITVTEPGYTLLTPVEWFRGMLDIVEQAGRTCYKSEDKITEGSAGDFVRRIIKSGHESVIEHCVITAKIFCSRACSHQLVRHRIAAYSQESQRYCDYGKLGLQVVCPPNIGPISHGTYELMSQPGEEPFWMGHDGIKRVKGSASYRFLTSINNSYRDYLILREEGVRPEDARFLLPNATKTEVVTTFNLRQWRHVFRHRALNKRAQWEIRKTMKSLLKKFTMLMPEVFGDLE
ncbi:MAG: FAD-dependent thymidylate synthase [Candidatus Omnitrophica bacterium]|nr:FAD-dependent thymidylate synthase [Candidatus Omnitrophota bacterium]